MAAVPTLSPTTSICYIYRGKPYELNFAILPTSTPLATSGTVWQAKNLPTGLTIDALTGKISGTPTVNGARNVSVRARGVGSTEWSAWMNVPFGVMDPPIPDTTEGATELRYNLETDLVYNPTTPEDAALRVTTNDVRLIALSLEEKGSVKRLPYFGRVQMVVKKDPDDTGITVADAQPQLRGSEGGWTYQFIMDLRETNASGITEMVESNLTAADSNIALLYAQITLHWYPEIGQAPNEDTPLFTSCQPFTILVTKQFAA
jgi:hypothetical protein